MYGLNEMAAILQPSHIPAFVIPYKKSNTLITLPEKKKHNFTKIGYEKFHLITV